MKYLVSALLFVALPDLHLEWTFLVSGFPTPGFSFVAFWAAQAARMNWVICLVGLSSHGSRFWGGVLICRSLWLIGCGLILRRSLASLMTVCQGQSPRLVLHSSCPALGKVSSQILRSRSCPDLGSKFHQNTHLPWNPPDSLAFLSYARLFIFPVCSAKILLI